MNQQSDVATTTSVVVVSAKSNEDQVVEMEIPIQHQVGVHPALILGEAIKVIRSNGGLLVDGPDTDLDFYPLLSLKGKVNFKEKRVVLSTGPSNSPRIRVAH